MLRASGGVVWRRDARERVEILLVHRPRYDDWSLPKGKREATETDEQCAAREVEEEAGLRCRLEIEVLPTQYRDSKGRDKTVRYWAMSVRADVGFRPSDEVDERRWLAVDDALDALTYEHDRAVVASLLPLFT